MKKTVLICFIMLLITNIFTPICFARDPDTSYYSKQGTGTSAAGNDKAYENCDCDKSENEFTNGDLIDADYAQCMTDCPCEALTEFRNQEAVEARNAGVKPNKDGNCTRHLVWKCNEHPNTYSRSSTMLKTCGATNDTTLTGKDATDWCIPQLYPYIECNLTEHKSDWDAIKQQEEEAGRTEGIGALGSDCPCPKGTKVTEDEEGIHFTCDIGSDDDITVVITAPYPTVAGVNPQYPLVGMLSGVIVEWEDGVGIEGFVPGRLTFGAPNGTDEPGDYYGAQVINGVEYTFTVSSLDTGISFVKDYADALVRQKNPLDRTNIAYAMPVSVEGVKILTPEEIYLAYKNNSKYVQAYTVFAGQVFGERPWTTYEKFVEGVCEVSAYPSDCVRALSWDAHRDLDLGPDYIMYLKNGNPALIGIYSEISSHGCHGATTVNDQGDPAFGLKFSSTWCFYVHAKWGSSSMWMLDDIEDWGGCCVDYDKVQYETTVYKDSRDGIACSPGTENCEARKEMAWGKVCKETKHLYSEWGSWNSTGGGSSSGDCEICHTTTKYFDVHYGVRESANDELFGVTFNQSQPLIKQPPRTN